MSLRVFNFNQRSEEWHEARRGIVTASVVGKLLTPTLRIADNDTSRGIVTTLAAERVAGFTEETGMSADMWRGVMMETYAREAYSTHHAPAVECGFMRRDETGWTLGYSPDGLVGDDGLIEIKCPRAKGHVVTILTDRVPDRYMAQLQCGLLVSGRKWIDYVSYCSGLPLYVKRVTPDERWQDAIVAAARDAERDIEVVVSDYLAAVVGLPTTERIDLDLEVVI